MSETYLVTGAAGCIGAWVVKLLAERGDRPVVLDLREDRRRLELIASPEVVAAAHFVAGDITDFGAVDGAIASTGATRIIHLAGLQVPFCKADPPLGAAVNVLGTVHMFEAAKKHGIPRLVYASSAAVYGPDAPGRASEADACHPTTHYGVYKCANEGNARVYHQDDGIHSIGLRPATVYGVGRDQGLTSDVTKAMKAAVVERPFAIRFTGETDVLLARDAAWAFIHAADATAEGAHAFNLHGTALPVSDIIAMIDEFAPQPCITMQGDPLPIPGEMVDASIRAVLPDLPNTPLRAGTEETMAAFAALREAGRLDVSELDV